MIRNTIKNKHIKAIVVGFPLDQDNMPMRHCSFIEEFLDNLANEKVLRRLPVTLINEYNSTA